MQRKEIITVGMVAFVAAIVSFVVAGALFNSPSKHNSTVPNVQSISSGFPDVKNDPNYIFFTNNPLDPAQPTQVGNAQNSNPFNGSSTQ